MTMHSFHTACDELASQDSVLSDIIQRFGYPPYWSRPNTFASLVHIILEQQVSLASALASFKALEAKLSSITPVSVQSLSQAEMKEVYVTRQKSRYIQELGLAITDGRLDLGALSKLSDQEVRNALITHKGVGNWTIDIYLIMVLHRIDIFPIGDLAAMQAVKQLYPDIHKRANFDLQWAPKRTIATMILWHFYLSSKKSTATKK